MGKNEIKYLMETLVPVYETILRIPPSDSGLPLVLSRMLSALKYIGYEHSAMSAPLAKVTQRFPRYSI